MDLHGWLLNLGLQQYEAAFRENDIDETLLPSLTAQDLKDIGVVVVGHRRKLLNAIGALSGNSVSARFDRVPALDASFPDTAERRQVTVMFADLVGSTALSTGMDPEDLRDVIASYQSRCTAAIRRYDGFVAKYIGDGILVYFGYPRAHEDEAERSVRAGLDIVDAMAELNAAVPRPPRGRARGADRHRHRTGDRRPDRRRNGIGDRGGRRDAEPGGPSAGIGAAEPDPCQRGHARDARRSFRPRESGGI